ncbi:MAG: flagellar biosynthetic protein FliO [Syntrophomonadaceae bacterium]|nr:flagellar biosynthetic protein FliO [Syntrophomonadaceae bacterium]
MLLSIVLIIHFFAAVSFAADIDELNRALDSPAEDSTVNYSLGWNFLKLIIALGLIIGAAWSIIRLFGRQIKTKMQGNWLHVVDEVVLGQNRGIVLCEVGERLYAVGVTDQNISFLFEVDDPGLIEKIKQEDVFAAEDREDSSGKDGMGKKLVSRIWGLNKSSSSNRNSFHLLMLEQAQKLEEAAARKHTGRSGADE